MKKFYALLLSGIIAATCCACNANISINTDDNNTETASTNDTTAQQNTSTVKKQENTSADTAFYGVWCCGTKSNAEADDFASEMINQGFDAQVFVTTDWENLNTELYYVVTAGVCATEADAEKVLTKAKESGYTDAYIKYTGEHK